MKKIKGFLISIAVTGATSLIVFGIAALVISKTGNLPQQPLLAVLVTLLSCCTVFLGGLAASLFTKEKGALMGGACGLFFACCILACAAGGMGFSVGAGGIARLAAIVLSGCLGGILGVNRKGRVKF